MKLKAKISYIEVGEEGIIFENNVLKFYIDISKSFWATDCSNVATQFKQLYQFSFKRVFLETEVWKLPERLLGDKLD